MSRFFGKKNKFTISERDPVYKVKYLGNVQTTLMKGQGCVDKPTDVLWNNFAKSNGTVGMEMKLTVCASGLKAVTSEQGLTEYRAHRISYLIAHPKYPRLFVWVYRHEGKKMKVELRCHAVLCKTEAKAKAMAVQLHDKLTTALSEFMREKTRRQNARLVLQRTNSLPTSGTGFSGVPLRKKFLNVGNNFKPPVERSSSAPKLGNISEDKEGEENSHHLSGIIEEEEEEEEIEEVELEVVPDPIGGGDQDSVTETTSDVMPDSTAIGSRSADDLVQTAKENGLHIDELAEEMYELEIGNDIDALKNDAGVQFQLNRIESDDDSSESGYSEHGTENGNANSPSSSSGTQNSPLSTRVVKQNGDVKTNGSVPNKTDSLPKSDVKHTNNNTIDNSELQISRH